MSAVLVIQQYDKVYIGSDTAISTKINNQYYRIGNSGQKLFHIDDKVIFCSGNLNISYSIINKYKNTKNKTIEQLQNVANKEYKDNNSNDLIEIIVVEQSFNKINVYQISSYNDFKIIERKVSKDDISMFTGGIKTKECFDTAYSLYMNNYNIKDIYIETFNTISNECIGGNMLLYEVNTNTIQQVCNVKINEKDILFLDINIKPHLVIAEQIYGKIIGSNKLVITNMNDKGESSFLVDGSHMVATNMDLSLIRKNLLNRIYMNPEYGFKIQKRDTPLSDWQDLLWLDMNGEIWAKAFHVINKDTTLDDKGLVVDNGKIKILNSNKYDALYADENGEMRLDGRLRVIRHKNTWTPSNKWDLEPEENRVILLDAYKDDDKGGKLLINNWNGYKNAFLGSSPSDKYIGGFFKLYNGKEDLEGGSKERIELGILAENDTGIINIKNNKEIPIISLLGHDKGGYMSILGQTLDSINVKIGAVNNSEKYEGGHIQLFNNSKEKERCFLGIRKNEDSGTLTLNGANGVENVLISAIDNFNDGISAGTIQLRNTLGQTSIMFSADTNLNPMNRGHVSQLVFGEDVKKPRLGIYSGNGEYGSYIQMGDKTGNPQMFIGNVSREETPGGNLVWYANMTDLSQTTEKRRIQIYVNGANNGEIALWDNEGAYEPLATMLVQNGELIIKHKQGRSMTFTSNGKILFN